ncbi:MAG: M28 family peptidase [Candidatus Lokiarchaeota archaeon]|nr:M28 family peptidase [Candidatus Lokiarchaeota archaeon]
MSEEEDLKQRITSIVKDYDSQGIHRTGTKVDEQSAHWLADKIKKIGLEPCLEGFSLDRIDVREASVELGTQKIMGLPLFDCTYPKEELIISNLGNINEENVIGITSVDNVTPKILEEQRKNNPNIGIIVATQGMTPGLSLINADNFTTPFGPPTLQISSENWPLLSSKIGIEVSFNIKISRNPKKAYNVITRLKGKDSGLAPLVIMTPRSGWWNCASERAGGIAILLELMRAFYYNKPPRDVLFLANSGHELGHLGLDHYLNQNSDLIKKASSWIHLGANISAVPQIGKKKPSSIKILVQSSDSEIEKLTNQSLAKYGIIPSVNISQGKRPVGEAKNIFDGGGRYFSILGMQNPLFHHQHDRWPDAVDINNTTIITKAVVFLGLQLAR